MDRILLTPGTVSEYGQSVGYRAKGEKLHTEHSYHARLYGANGGPLTRKLGSGFASLPTVIYQSGQQEKAAIESLL